MVVDDRGANVWFVIPKYAGAVDHAGAAQMVRHEIVRVYELFFFYQEPHDSGLGFD